MAQLPERLGVHPPAVQPVGESWQNPMASRHPGTTVLVIAGVYDRSAGMVGGLESEWCRRSVRTWLPNHGSNSSSKPSPETPPKRLRQTGSARSPAPVVTLDGTSDAPRSERSAHCWGTALLGLVEASRAAESQVGSGLPTRRIWLIASRRSSCWVPGLQRNNAFFIEQADRDPRTAARGGA